MGIGAQFGAAHIIGLPPVAFWVVAVASVLAALLVGLEIGRSTGRRQLSQRLNALGTRLGLDPPAEEGNLEDNLAYLEQVTGAATEAVASSSSDAIRLRRSLDTLPQGVVLCDENGTVVYRNARASALMISRHGDALAAQAVTELLEDAWHENAAERTLDLYGPPRRTLTVRAEVIDDGRRPLGVIAMIEDVSERRRLEEIRRDFVANVSHELKTPMGALGLLAETLVSEPDVQVAQRLAGRIHTEAFRVSRIIDDLLDLSRIESEVTPPREPVEVNLVMADAVERVRAIADQRGIIIDLREPDPPVAVMGDRRQLVSAMHALLENAVTYSYDLSTVTVTGTVVAAEPGGGATPWAGPEEPAVAEPLRPAGELAPAVDLRAGTGGGSGPPGLDDTEPGGTSAAASAAGGSAGPYDDLSGPPTAPPVVEDAPPVTPPATTATTAPGGPVVLNGSADAGAGGDGEGDPPGRPMVHLTVADQGIGIPARDLQRIFERFYRVDHGRSRDTGGTGLGLSIVRHVASNHQGWVDVESREGEGSTFTLVLPLRQDPT